ncbi:toll/interleukin-1 receptor domain-containing protein [Pseudoxanthomonas mexicana]
MIRTDQLSTAARFSPTPPYTSLYSAKMARRRTAFLCHSHKDELLAKGLAHLLWQWGWHVYIDWQDASMPPTPDRTTARKIQDKILATDFFLFLATSNSMASRWCPWELGFADGKKSLDSILVVPTRDGTSIHGNEYLALYRHIDHNALDHPVVRAAGGSRLSEIGLSSL